MAKFLPAVLGLCGLALGAGAGQMLRPDDEATIGSSRNPSDQEAPLHAGAENTGSHVAEETSADEDHAENEGGTEGSEATLPDYVRLNNQFIIPVVEEGRVSATVVLSLSLEVPAGGTEAVYAREPRLRDALLQVLFDHANAGGFRGVFTDGANLIALRSALKEAAQKILGDDVTDVLISDLVRQDA